MKRLIWIFRAARYLYTRTGGGHPGRKWFWAKECWGVAESAWDNAEPDDRGDPEDAMDEELSCWED